MKESTIKATMQIGQFGMTDSVVAELRAQVHKKKVVKVKRLRNASAAVEAGEKNFWKELGEKAGVRLLEVRGHTAVYCDPRYRTEREQGKARRPEPERPRRLYQDPERGTAAVEASDDSADDEDEDE